MIQEYSLSKNQGLMDCVVNYLLETYQSLSNSPRIDSSSRIISVKWIITRIDVVVTSQFTQLSELDLNLFQESSTISDI